GRDAAGVIPAPGMTPPRGMDDSRDGGGRSGTPDWCQAQVRRRTCAWHQSGGARRWSLAELEGATHHIDRSPCVALVLEDKKAVIAVESLRRRVRRARLSRHFGVLDTAQVAQ